MGDAIEIPTDHRCRLGALTDELASAAARGERGSALAERARSLLARLLSAREFDTCCVPKYLALAPREFPREVQLPVASSDHGRLDTRVLLWPIGAKDREHPHAEGWAVFASVRGRLTVSERRNGEGSPERQPSPRRPELLEPEDGVRHHVHNRGEDVGLSVHVFGT